MVSIPETAQQFITHQNRNLRRLRPADEDSEMKSRTQFVLCFQASSFVSRLRTMVIYHCFTQKSVKSTHRTSIIAILELQCRMYRRYQALRIQLIYIFSRKLAPFQFIDNYHTHRSLDTPSIKHTTHGNTLIISFSTSHGTFSTNTRINRVAKYFGASFWIYIPFIRHNSMKRAEIVRTARCLSMISHRLKFLW
jgi:hypothetical protein